MSSSENQLIISEVTTPTSSDVLCGTGNATAKHPGNNISSRVVSKCVAIELMVWSITHQRQCSGEEPSTTIFEYSAGAGVTVRYYTPQQLGRIHWEVDTYISLFATLVGLLQARHVVPLWLMLCMIAILYYQFHHPHESNYQTHHHRHGERFVLDKQTPVWVK